MSALLAALTAALAAFLAARGRQPRQRRTPAPGPRPRPAQVDLVEFHAQFAALVGAGLEPGPALRRLAEATTDPALAATMADAVAALSTGTSAVEALGRDPRLGALAATLALVETTGAPAGPTLARLAQAAADEEDARLAVRSALAAPLATARVLAVLPVIGLLLGQVMGADPVGVLLGTAPGRVSALVGVVCSVLGVLWARRLVRQARTP